MIEHGGDINGFSCHLLRMPEDRLFVMVLSNNPFAPKRPDAVALRLAARGLGRSVGGNGKAEKLVLHQGGREMPAPG